MPNIISIEYFTIFGSFVAIARVEINGKIMVATSGAKKTQYEADRHINEIVANHQ